MIIIPASDIIQTNYRTHDGMVPTLSNINGDFNNIQLIGYNANYLADGGINLASVAHAYPYNLIANTIPENDQGEALVSSINMTKGINLPAYSFNYRDKSSALIIVIVYDSNNNQYINLSGVTSLNIIKAKQAAIPVYCYLYINKSTCSSIYQIDTDNSETIASFYYYYNDTTITINESGAVIVSNSQPEEPK